MSQSLIVIAVRTLPTTLRSQARKLIRMAITQVLADKLSCPYAEIKLTSNQVNQLRFRNHDKISGFQSAMNQAYLLLLSI